jgi:hypothetical protein
VDGRARWLKLPEGAIKFDGAPPSGRRPAAGIGQPQSERIAVSAISRVVLRGEEKRIVRIVGVSATSAEVVSPRPIGHAGQVVECFLPVVGNRELRLTAGIMRVDEGRGGYTVLLHFMIADIVLRRQLNELIALLLAGDGDAHRQPTVIYDTLVRYGARGERVGHLAELSPRALSLRMSDRMAAGTPILVTIPDFAGRAPLRIEGRVAAQRLSREGGYHTAVTLDEMDAPRRRALSSLIADLMCR